MTFDELLDFTEKQNIKLNKHFPIITEKEKVFGRVVKLMEELGEFCDEIMSHNKGQRQEKLDNYDKKNLSKEFADVVICTLLLGQELNIDIKKALKDKIKELNKRSI